MLIKASRDSADENGRNEDRGEDQGEGNDRPGHFLHRLEGGFFGVQALIDVSFGGFHHHDGIIHHQSDGEDQAEEGQRVDGESKQRKEGEGADKRHWHGQQGN